MFKKKIILSCLLMAIACIMATGCSSCQSENKKQEIVYHDYDGIVQDFTAGVSHIQTLHRQNAYQLTKDCNPQWTFGDEYNVIFIDAVTGEIRNWNPAFHDTQDQ